LFYSFNDEVEEFAYIVLIRDTN